MTPSELGQAVKQKYPGSYDSYPDEVVGQRWIVKNPSYKAFLGDGNNAERIEPGVYGDTDPGHMNEIVNGLASGMATSELGGLGLEAGAKVAGKIAPAIEDIANEASFRTLGGRLKNARELGPEGVKDLGRFGLDSGVTGFRTNKMLGGIDKVISDSGQKIQNLRLQADVSGGAPKMADMVGEIQKRLGPKFASGVESGGQGQFQNAIDELLKANPMSTPAEGDVVASEMKDASPFSAVRPRNVNRAMAREVEKAPGFQKTSKAYQAVRQVQEEGIPEYSRSDYQPTFSDYADRATHLNNYAEKQAGLLQDKTPATDVANVVSQVNNEGIARALGPEKYAEYEKQLSIFNNASMAKKMILQKSAREVAGRTTPGFISHVYQATKDKFFDPFVAKSADALANALSGQ